MRSFWIFGAFWLTAIITNPTPICSRILSCIAGCQSALCEYGTSHSYSKRLSPYAARLGRVPVRSSRCCSDGDRSWSLAAMSPASYHSETMSTDSRLYDIRRYYDKAGSRLGYRWLLGGTRHYGYYPHGRRLSISRAQRLMERRLGEALALPSHSLVLDGGSGEGRVATQLANEFRYRVRGIDLHRSSVERAQRSAGANGDLDVAFSVGDYADTSFAAETFDGVYTIETLVHAPDHQAALAEFWRVLAPGGHIALFEYSIDPADQRTAVQERLWRAIAEGTAMHSLMSFEHGRFSEILGDAGFEDIVVTDITEATLPMIHLFYHLAWLPYQIVRRLGLERQHPNTAAAAGLYKDIVARRAWRYNIVTAKKPT
jgi:sterol 24-C-methyltransferase